MDNFFFHFTIEAPSCDDKKYVVKITNIVCTCKSDLNMVIFADAIIITVSCELNNHLLF